MTYMKAAIIASVPFTPNLLSVYRGVQRCSNIVTFNQLSHNGRSRYTWHVPLGLEMNFKKGQSLNEWQKQTVHHLQEVTVAGTKLY